MSTQDDLPDVPNVAKGELAEGLAILREDAGLPPPVDAELEAPDLCVKLTIDKLAQRVADLLRHSDGRWGIFRKDDAVVRVAVDGVSGKPVMQPVTSKWFRQWFSVIRSVKLYEQKVKKSNDQGEEQVTYKPGEFTKDQADMLLEPGGIVFTKLPVIRGVHSVKMPVFCRERNPNGQPLMRLLKPGYDPITGIYTWCDPALDYDENMDVFEAVEYIHSLFRFFGWRNIDRDFAIHLAAIITMFCRELYEGKAPAFAYIANQQDSGKTRLATWVTWLVWGTRATKRLLPDNDDKLETMLGSVAMSGSPYVNFDNVDWKGQDVMSPVLDQWIDGKEWSVRKFHSQTEVDPPIRGVTLFTGNNMKLSTDLQRRTLMIDILNRVPGHEKELSDKVILLDDSYFAKAENRKKALAAVWAIVRAWDERGRPARPGRLLNSFEEWARVIPSIVWNAGRVFSDRIKWDCLQVSENDEIGDKKGREKKELAELALVEFGLDENGQMQSAFEITVQQFAGLARRTGKAVWTLYPHMDIQSVMQTEGQREGWSYSGKRDAQFFDPDNEDSPASQADRERDASEWLNPKTRSSFGNMIKGAVNEKHFKGPDGHMYEMMHRKGVTPACYLVSRVK